MRLLQRLGFEAVVVDAIEIALVAEVVGGPDALEHLDELLRAAVALVMLQPGLADGLELAPEPPRDDVDGDAPVGQVIDGGDLLGQHHRIPRAGQDGGDDFQSLGGSQQRVADGHRLVLELGAIAGGEADLRQRVVKARLLGGLHHQAAVVVDASAGALFDPADDEAAADIGHPVDEFDLFLAHGMKSF